MHFYKSDGMSVGAIYRFCEPGPRAETTFFCGGGVLFSLRPCKFFSFFRSVSSDTNKFCINSNAHLRYTSVRPSEKIVLRYPQPIAVSSKTLSEEKRDKEKGGWAPPSAPLPYILRKNTPRAKSYLTMLYTYSLKIEKKIFKNVWKYENNKHILCKN